MAGRVYAFGTGVAPLAALLLAAAPAVAAQELGIPPVTYPALAPTAADARGFVPPGWSVVASRRGDLNGDSAADLVLLLRMNDPANILAIPLGGRTERFDTNPHLLVIAFAAPRGGYRLAASNRGLFPRPERPWTGEEPPGEDTLRLERGSLRLTFTYLRGWAAYRFRWQGGAFRLIGYDRAGASGGCVETVSIDYLTGRARLTNDAIESYRTRITWRRLGAERPPTLDRIDMDDFWPDRTIAGPPLPCRGRGR